MEHQLPQAFADLALETIEQHDDGSASVRDAYFGSVEAAERYAINRALLERHLREQLVIEEQTERMLAARDSMRAQTQRMVAELAREQREGAIAAHETEQLRVVSYLGHELRRHRTSIVNALEAAESCASRLPDALGAWADGTLHSGHLRVLERVAERLDDDLMPQFEAEVLAQSEGRTPSQLRRIAERVANRLHSSPDHERANAAAADRAVWIEQQSDGMAHLTIKTTAVLAEAALDRLRCAAKQAPADDGRRMQQHMSDTAITALVSGTCDAGLLEGITANVTLTMPATLVARGRCTAGESGAELPSGQLIDAKTALLLAAGAASWTRLFTDPASGVVVTADTYQPTASLRRLIIARDATCRFPGCAQPARRCDIDHTDDWQHGGRTVPGNLAALCRHHHTLKHRLRDDGWQVRQLSLGVLEWTAPDGRRHRVEPEPVATAHRHANVAPDVDAPPGEVAGPLPF